MTVEEIKAKFTSINPTAPYIFLLNYKKFETMSNIKMQLISAEFCPLLDDSVILAQKWKGKRSSFALTITLTRFSNRYG